MPRARAPTRPHSDACLLLHNPWTTKTAVISWEQINFYWTNIRFRCFSVNFSVEYFDYVRSIDWPRSKLTFRRRPVPHDNGWKLMSFRSIMWFIASQSVLNERFCTVAFFSFLFFVDRLFRRGTISPQRKAKSWKSRESNVWRGSVVLSGLFRLEQKIHEISSSRQPLNQPEDDNRRVKETCGCSSNQKMMEMNRLPWVHRLT